MDKVKTIIIAVLGTAIGLFVILYIIGSRDKTPTAPATGSQQQATSPATEGSGAAAQPSAQTPEVAPALTQKFSEAATGYTMNYPADWTYEKQGEGWDTVVFSGKAGTDAYRATVNVQNILTKSNGGTHATVADLMTNLKSQFAQSEDPKLVDEKPLSYTTAKGENIEGVQLLVEYGIKGEQFRQWQIAVPRPDGKYYHAIAYTAPIAIFDRFQPTAQAIIESWSMVE